MQVRLWDPERCEKTQKSVIKVYGRGRRKGEVSTVCMDGCGCVVCVPVCDGSLQVFPVRGPFHRPAQTVPAAFAPGDTVCSMCFVREKETVVLRTLSGLVRLWDLRSTRQPLAARSDVAALYDGTEVITDPRHKFVVAGAAGARDRGSRLVFMDASTLETVREVEDSAVVTSLLWHPKLNQVCVPHTPSRSCHHALAIMLSLSHSRSVRVPDVPAVLLLVLVGAWCLVLGAHPSPCGAFAARRRSERRVVEGAVRPDTLRARRAAAPLAAQVQGRGAPVRRAAGHRQPRHAAHEARADRAGATRRGGPEEDAHARGPLRPRDERAPRVQLHGADHPADRHQEARRRRPDRGAAQARRRRGRCAAHAAHPPHRTAHPRYFGAAYAKTQPETLFTDENDDEEEDEEEDEEGEENSAAGSDGEEDAGGAKRLRRA